jgi:hypothetical protein
MIILTPFRQCRASLPGLVVAFVAGIVGGSFPVPAPVAWAATTDYLATGRLRPAFDHLGNLNGQIEAAATGRCTLVYATGIGAYSYVGLPPKSVMDAYLAQCAAYNQKAHKGGVGIVLSYLCATSIVGVDTFATNWSDYFPARRAGFKPELMLQQDINGQNLPSWYGTNYAPADMWNPFWREYTKLTIKMAADSGHDGIYFDNPTVHTKGNYSVHAMKAWAQFLKTRGVKADPDDTKALRALTTAHPELWRQFRVTEAAEFIREMRGYCRSLKSGFLITVNNSLNSWDSFYSQPRGYAYSIPQQSQYEDLVTIEDMSSQPRRQGDAYVSYAGTLRLLQALANGRPLSICTTDGDYVCPPAMMGLAIAECTAHDAAYMAWTCWEPAYRRDFAAGLARYHQFLDQQSALIHNSQLVADLLLVWPYENWIEKGGCMTAELAREMSAANLQYDVALESELTPERLDRYPLVAYAGNEALVRTNTHEMLRAYQRRTRGHVIPVIAAALPKTRKLDWHSAVQALGGGAVGIEGQGGVRGVVRRASAGRLLLHLYNLNVNRKDSYHDNTRELENVRISWTLPAEAPALKQVRLFTPDADATSGPIECRETKQGIRQKVEFVVPKLSIWTVVTCE